MYDFLCDDCEFDFEAFLIYEQLTDGFVPKQLPRCPKCGQKSKVRKIIKNSVPVLYRGEGFTKKVKE
jgi:NAD-dependent SIR2 family protein deacetylase